jgi:hypothetical protein
MSGETTYDNRIRAARHQLDAGLPLVKHVAATCSRSPALNAGLTSIRTSRLVGPTYHARTTASQLSRRWIYGLSSFQPPRFNCEALGLALLSHGGSHSLQMQCSRRYPME